MNEETIRAACRMIQALAGKEESHPKSHYVKSKGDVLFVAVDPVPMGDVANEGWEGNQE